jgi:acyl-coenzyme A synthetase/AMP-(fatty) acid ligase
VTANRVALEDDRGIMTFAQLETAAAVLRAGVPYGARIAVRGTRGADVAVAATGLDGWATDVILVGGRDVTLPSDIRWLDEFGVDSGPSTPGPRVATRWHLYTSGTTGVPKSVSHSLDSLARTVPRSAPDGPAYSWGLLYAPTSMAGVQVLLHSLGGRGRLLDATRLPRIIDRVDWLATRGVDALSATPTLWRQILQCPGASRLRLRQITLGGEIADQPLLDTLRRAQPDARVTHVFASTETGAAFSVSDGLAGFPRRYLTDPPGGIRLDVRDGVLFVEAPQSSYAGPDGFASTGDVVTVTDNRVYFQGRGSGVANVAGVKVWPERVEAVLRQHPQVEDAVVLVRRNAFSGSVLTAKVVPVPGAEVSSLPARLRAYCAERLESAAVPASVAVVPALTLSATGKVGRR